MREKYAADLSALWDKPSNSWGGKRMLVTRRRGYKARRMMRVMILIIRDGREVCCWILLDVPLDRDDDVLVPATPDVELLAVACAVVLLDITEIGLIQVPLLLMSRYALGRQCFCQ